MTARGADRRPIFVDASDRRWFMTLFEQVMRRFSWSCLTYCLMHNHYHLLVLTREPTLALGMHQLNGRYAQRFNQRHNRVGHLFQSRYHAEPIVRDAHLLEVLRYIAQNPVRAGLAENPAAYRWSGHRALAGIGPGGPVAIAEALSYLHPDREQARDEYRSLVEGEQHDLPRIPTRADAGEPPRPSVAQILRWHPPDEAIAVAQIVFGYTVREIAAVVGCHPSTVSRRIRARRAAPEGSPATQRA